MVAGSIEFLRMKVELWKFEEFSDLVRITITQGTWLASEVRTVSLHQPVESIVHRWYQKSVDLGWHVGCWELDGCWKNHVFGVRKNPTVTHHCDVMAQVRLEDRQVRKARS